MDIKPVDLKPVDLKPVDLTEPVVVENVSIDVSPEHFTHLTTEIDKLKQENSDLLREIQELRKKTETTVHKYETTIIEQKPQIDEASIQKIKDLECRLLQVEYELGQKTKEFERELSTRDFTNQDLLLKINELKEREPALLSSIETRTRERDSLLFKVEDMKKERDIIIFERENLLKSLQDIKVQLAELKEAYSNVLAELTQARATISFLEGDIKNLRDEIAARQEENRAVLLRLAEVEGARLEVDSLRRVVEETLRERDRALQASSAKDAEIATLKNQIDKYVRDVQTKKDVIGHITGAEEVLVNDISALRKQLTQQDELMKELVARENEYKAQEPVYKEAIEILKREKTNIFTEVEELRIENQRLRVENEQLLPERDNLLHLVSQKDAQIAMLGNDFSKVSQENRDLMNVVSDLEKKRDSLLLVFGEREAEIRRLKDSFEEASNGLQFFKEKSRLLDEENQKYREKAKELEKENAGLKLQVRIIPDLQNKINELTAVNDQLKLQLEQFEATKVQVSHLQSQIDGLILNRDNLLLSVQEKEGELSRLRPIVSEYELLKIRAEAYEQEIQKLKILVAADMIRMQEFETMIANLQFSVKNEKELAEQNDKLLKENLAFRQKVQELEYSYGTLSTKYHKMESIYAQIKGVAENIGEVHEKLIETCEETEKIDSNLKNIETSENKTVIQQLEYTETPQRF